MAGISRIAMFLEVVKQQSFADAARALGMTGPAVSKQVRALEDELGVKLLHRTTRQVSLTEEGAIYSERARKALEDLQEAEHYIQDLRAWPKGLLKVNAPMSFGRRYLTQPIAAFAKQYPDVQMEVDFDDRHIDMISEGYDVVVRIGALEDSSLIARKLAPCPIPLCASPELLERYGTPKTPEELKDYPALIYSRHGVRSEWRYQDAEGKIGVAPLRPQLFANNAELMLEGCLQGIGIALLPIFTAAPHIKSGQLVQILPEYETHPARNIYAMFPQNRYLSTKTRLFVDWLSDASGAFPWE